MIFFNKNLVIKVVDKELCVGCGLCETLFGADKVKMSLSSKGFLAPTISSSFQDTDNKLFQKVCAGLNVENNKSRKIWGDLIKVRIGFSVDEHVRYTGASGGSISALACYLLGEKIVDSIIHIGPADTDPLMNETKISSTPDEVIKNAGSRYSPAAPLTVLGQLEERKKYAFIGRPCDVFALKEYIDQTNNYKDQIKYFFSFFCAGIPSLNGTLEVLRLLNVDQKEVKSIRYRGEGWPGFFKVELNDGKVLKKKYSETWGTVLNKYIAPRCHKCRLALGSEADIVFADAWYRDSYGEPDFEERKGLNLIITRTEKGEKLLLESVSKNIVGIKDEITEDQIRLFQPYQYKKAVKLNKNKIS
ncbi:MAG: Coenzyme F420 hydrogenase/dehydrogenase, beta subunit C-terminal domain [Candidatus Omnitrophica bacterium]|nr:Coenzyme F420 hydrogenase/dehydrogenase, beta subunit C-terminal domain [Candidatus Omnitrophota bacterium]